jgi:hypothetical protein
MSPHTMMRAQHLLKKDGKFRKQYQEKLEVEAKLIINHESRGRGFAPLAACPTPAV